MTQLTITRPDDWHVHLRDGEVLKDTVRDISRYNGRALIMPNTVPPDSGVTSAKNIYHVLEAMQEVGMLLLVHGEVTTHDVDIFDREKEFLDTVLAPIVNDFPNLKIVLEHITTADAATFVKNANENVAATITAHHLLYNRNHMLVGGIKPHFYCLPILKRNTHQQALIEAATSGSKKFFLGTDSAPHAKGAKESACGCAGSYTAHAAVELYAEVFEQEGKLENLEAFASHNGPDFYGVPRNTDTVTLTKKEWNVAETMPFGSDIVVPIRGGETIGWTVK
ncbi:dihydroorotase [Vibrio fortis]